MPATGKCDLNYSFSKFDIHVEEELNNSKRRVKNEEESIRRTEQDLQEV